MLILDNASADDSVAQARATARPADWTLLSDNIGFASGNNRLAEKARGEFLCLLNPDTVLTADALTPLAAYLREHPEAGVSVRTTSDRTASGSSPSAPR